MREHRKYLGERRSRLGVIKLADEAPKLPSQSYEVPPVWSLVLAAGTGAVWALLIAAIVRGGW